MRVVEVPLAQNPYEIRIGGGALEDLAGEAAGRGEDGVVVVSDQNIWALNGAKLEKILSDAGIAYSVAVVPAGEESKSMARLAELYAQFAEAALGRKGLVLAFGGGVVGDLAGFAAATWMRGVDYIQIPTSLLAMVDSSVGGKTGIDLPAGKNLAGAFYQPRLVLTDTRLLDTLPLRELRCGVAEMVKYGAIFSRPFFAEFQEIVEREKLPAMIEACCAMKRDTVLVDERDNGRRMLLNFGHSFGHAMEKLGGYSLFKHGEAVAAGMVLAAAFGEKKGVSPAGCAEALGRTLSVQGLPGDCPFGPGELARAMALDKKGRGDGLDLVLLKELGEAVVQWFSLEEIERTLEELL